MRSLVLIAVSLVLASAVTVRLTEVERSAAVVSDSDTVFSTFTTTNPKYANSIFLITNSSIIRRYSSGSKTVIFDFAASNLAGGFGGRMRTAAIHPTKPILVLGWIRNVNATANEGHQWWARNESHARATPATQIVTVATFTFNEADDNNVTLASRKDLFEFGGWDLDFTQYDLGEIRFQTVADKHYLWIPTANSYPQTLGIWDYFQQGREAGSYQGRLLRYDLDQPFPHTPLDNPFINSTVRNSVYTSGFTYPRSVLFTETNDVWLTDYQSGVADEINNILPAKDYGWNILEGTKCIQPPRGCSSKNTILPAYSWNITSGAGFTYGLSGAFYYGEGQFVLSWFGNEQAATFRHFNATARTSEDVELVDQHDVATNWHYSGMQFNILSAPIADSKKFYVFGQWPNNRTSVIFIGEVIENGAAQVSILVALIITIVATLLH